MRIANTQQELTELLRDLTSLIAQGRVEEAVALLFTVEGAQPEICEKIRFGIHTYGTYDPDLLDDPDTEAELDALWPVALQNEAAFHRSLSLLLHNSPMVKGYRTPPYSGISCATYDTQIYAGYAACYLMQAEATSDLRMEFWIRRMEEGFMLEFHCIST